MALTDTAIRLAKAVATDRKLADSKGLYLLVTASGSKLWRLKYRIDGKEKKLALGSYPEVGLKMARARRDAARQSAQAGSDPSIAKREARIAKRIAAANTFGGIAEEYIAKLEAEGKAAVTIAKARWPLTQLSPALGTRPIAEISPHELLAVLKKSSARGSARRRVACDPFPVAFSATPWQRRGRPSIRPSRYGAHWSRRSPSIMRPSPIRLPSGSCCGRSKPIRASP